MHDELIERRLRDALRQEGDSLAFTITAAELDRRYAQRHRGTVSRRGTLLLAATIGIGVVGVGGIVGALMQAPKPAPQPSQVANATLSPTIGPAPAVLASLDDILAGADPAAIVLAGAHDDLATGERSDVPIPEPYVDLGVIAAGTSYELRAACEGDGSLMLDIAVPFSRGPRSGPAIECNGVTVLLPLAPPQPQSVSFSAPFLSSWRVVVVRTGSPLDTDPVGEPPLLIPVEGYEPLITAERTANPGPSPDALGRSVEPIAAVPARWAYAVDAWCEGGAPMQYIHGGDVAGQFRVATRIEIPCDGKVHAARLGFLEIGGTEAFVAVRPGVRWSLLVSAETPPVALASDVPGWQLTMGWGPELSFEEHGISLSDAREHGGRVMFVMECAAPRQEIDVLVDVEGILGDEGSFESFPAECTPDGTRTSHTFGTKPTGYLVQSTAPAGSWTALSVLIPEGSPEP